MLMLCEQVRGFPTIKLFKADNTVVDYSGGRWPLYKKNYYFYKKSNLFMHRLDIYIFVMCHTQNLKSWNRRTLEDFIKFLRPSEEAAVEEEVKPSGDGEKVKKIELWL